jgi:drug/metabolite transporter (DMT)-like permease
MVWSLLAGIVGAAGAFGVLLAFGSRGTPSVVMSIVFAGAPLVNAVVALSVHPPAGGLGSIRWPFFAGILLAALGGCLITLYKPNPAPPPARSQAVAGEPVAGARPPA